MNTRLYLDVRHPHKNGCCALKVSLMHRGESARISLGMELEPDRWDSTSMQVTKGADKAYLNMELRKKLTEVTEIAGKVLVALDRDGVVVNATELKNRVKRTLGQSIELSSDVQEVEELPTGESLVDYFEKIMNQYHGSTYEKYKYCLKHIKMYASNWRMLTFEDINGRWLQGLEDSMKKNGCKSADTRSMYLRPFKHVCQCAWDEELIARNPFQKYHFKIKQEQPVHKVMDTDALRTLVRMELEPWREKYRDFFWLSFMLRGMNPIDMLTMRRSQIRDGYLHYRRTKTDKEIVIKIEPEMQLIFDKYKGSKNVLWFCDGQTLTGDDEHDEKVKAKCKPFRDHVNKYLQQLEGYDYLTLYWARHTWSTIGYDVTDDFKAIEIGLGHSKGVTDRYVKAYQKKVDEANRKVIDYVLNKEITDKLI